MPDALNPDLNDLDLDGPDGPAEDDQDPGLLDQIADLLGGGPGGAPVMPGDLGAVVGDPGGAGIVDGGQPVAPVVPVDVAPVVPVDEAPVAPVVELPVDPEPDVPIAPVVELPVAPVDEAPVAPVVELPVAPVDEAPVPPVGEPAVDPAPAAPVDEAPVPPVDEAPVPPVDESTVEPVDVPPVAAVDAVPHEPVVIDLPVDLPTVELPTVVTDAVADPTASLDEVTASLTDVLGPPSALPDFHVAAPTADHATLLLPDAPDLPALQVTDVDHAAGTVSALPVGAPTGAPPMTFPLADVEAAHAESGSPALSFAAGGLAGALTGVTVAAVAARRLRRA